MYAIINRDELWPIYTLEQSDHPAYKDDHIDIPEDKLKEIDEVFANFWKVQKYLKGLYKNELL